MVDVLIRASILVDLRANHFFVCFPIITAPFDIVVLMPDMKTPLRVHFISTTEALETIDFTHADGALLKRTPDSETMFIQQTATGKIEILTLPEFVQQASMADTPKILRRRYVSRVDEAAVASVARNLIARGVHPFIVQSNYVPLDLVAYDPQAKAIARLRVGSGIVQGTSAADYLVIQNPQNRQLQYFDCHTLYQPSLAIQLR